MLFIYIKNALKVKSIIGDVINLQVPHATFIRGSFAFFIYFRLNKLKNMNFSQINKNLTNIARTFNFTSEKYEFWLL